MKDKPNNIMNKRKPKTQSGFASFSMHELAELITKPKQNELRNTNKSRRVH